jgi:hypothetical protein
VKQKYVHYMNMYIIHEEINAFFQQHLANKRNNEFNKSFYENGIVHKFYVLNKHFNNRISDVISFKKTFNKIRKTEEIYSVNVDNKSKWRFSFMRVLISIA